MENIFNKESKCLHRGETGNHPITREGLETGNCDGWHDQ